MKIYDIRYAIIKQSLIIAGVLGVFSGVVWYVDMLDGEYIQKVTNVKLQGETIAKQLSDLSAEYAGVTSSMDVYNEIKLKKEKNMLTVSSKVLKNAINSVRDQYYFEFVGQADMGDIKDRTEEKFKKATTVIESSNVTMEVDGLSDVDIFGFINAIQSSFSGVKMLSVKLTTKDLDTSSLIAIREKGFAPVVKAKITFVLSGFHAVSDKSVEPLVEETGKTNNKNNAPTRIRLRPGL